MKNKLKRLKEVFLWIKKRIKNEKKFFGIVITILIIILIIPSFSKKYLTEIPKEGGEIIEIGIGETPLFINPILAISDADTDLLPLIYTPLLERNSEGKIIPAAAYVKISENKKVYTIEIDQNIFFSNGEKLMADDVIFTIEKIQDPLLKSPYYSNWLSVKTEKINDYSLKIILPEEYYQFDNILATLYILPKTAWTGISPTEFPFSPLNTRPIGSGPYFVSKISRDPNTGKIRKYQLQKNENYYKGDVFPEFISFYYFNSFDDYSKSLIFSDRKKIKNIFAINQNLIQNFNSEKSYIKSSIVSLKTPKMFAIFLGKNYNNDLSNKALRKALSLIIDKKNITNNILSGYASPLDNIFLNIPSKKSLAVSEDKEIEELDNLEEAKKIIKKSIFKLNEKNILINTKTKKEVKLTISIINSTEFKKIAQSIKNDLKKIGILAEVVSYPEDELINDVIRNREFEILIYGYQLDTKPDYYYIFHSSQLADPGINIAEISNKKADQLLIELRKNIPLENRVKKEKELNREILNDYSFIPIYRPDFIYLMDSRIKNFNKKVVNSRGERFNNIDQWYVLTQKILPMQNK